MLHMLKLHSLSWPPGGNSSGCIEVSPSSLSHLQVVQEPGQVQASLGSIPVVVRPDVFEPSIGKHTVVVLWEEEEEEEDQTLRSPWTFAIVQFLVFRALTPRGRRHVDGRGRVVHAVVPAAQELGADPQRTGAAQRLDPPHLRRENLK